ncbi:Type 2 dna topoisomerase 6 subunit b-like [Thalictrum thalictroides]|uniref:Type 2 dna topoisomerase 6 subunit b-like n=1 Tax=Thalictrum thalictroides TaxID=46969 RepID=A0A7J6WT70_THATH|nr:Type 2 dna topoisomerase 6 subunit b-like [Thalictrum thalictroides]
MEINFTQKICLILIGSAFQRCRISENLCRLIVSLKCSTDSNRPIVQISISDTGVGSRLEEFQNMDCTRNGDLAEKWDGVLNIKTTSEVYGYCLNFKEKVPARRLTKLPPTSKKDLKFSGTETSLSTYESFDVLCAGIIQFLHKMHMLKIPNVAVELMVDRTTNTGSKLETLFQANAGMHLPFSISNIERLVAGLEGHVLKHGNALDKECQSCLSSREHFKLGMGIVPNSEGTRNNGQIIEAVIIITELPEPPGPSCLRVSSTEVFYFQEFLPSTIPQSLVNAVTSVNWKSYGLSLKSSIVGEDGQLVLEWESLPPYSHIDIAIHCYHDQYPIIP